MSDVRRLDEVSIFNDKLTFLIPHEWIEVESGEDGTYLYQVPDVRSGWFRVSLVTISNVARPAERLAELFSNHENVSHNTNGKRFGRGRNPVAHFLLVRRGLRTSKQCL
jgi:hypothetical protein